MTPILLCVSSIIFFTQTICLVTPPQNPPDLVNIDDLLQIYRKHFIQVHSLCFTILQSNERRQELNEVASSIMKKIAMATRVQERNLSKNITERSRHWSPVEVVTVPGRRSERNLVKIKSLSSDSIEGHVVVVWNTDTLLAFLEEEYQLVVPDPRAMYALLLVSPRCKTLDSDLSHVLQTLWVKYGAANVIANTPYVCGSTHIYVYHPFVKTTSKTWGLTHRYAIKDVVKNFDLVVNTFDNFHQLPLHVSLFVRMPTAVKTLPKLLRSSPIYQDVSRSGGFGGVDGCLLGVLAQHLNFNAVVGGTNISYGRVWPNGSITGTLRSLVNRQTIYNANGWFLTDYHTDQIESTVPYSFDQVCAVAPKAPRVPQWKSLFKCFDLTSWILIFLIWVCCALFWHYLNSSRSTIVTLWEMYSILLGIPVKIPQVLRQFFFLASCMVFNIVIMGVIQGSFFTDFTTVTFYKDINTLEELDGSGVSIATSTWYLDYDTSQLIRSLKSKQVENKNHAFKTVAYQRNLAVLERKQDVEILIKTKFLAEDGSPLLHIVNECLHSFQLVNMLPKGSPFLHAFNHVIRKVFESGLTMKWYEDVIDSSIRENMMVLDKQKASAHAFYMPDVQLAFYVLVWGHVSGILVFLYELSKKNCRFRKTK